MPSIKIHEGKQGRKPLNNFDPICPLALTTGTVFCLSHRQSLVAPLPLPCPAVMVLIPLRSLCSSRLAIVSCCPSHLVCLLLHWGADTLSGRPTTGQSNQTHCFRYFHFIEQFPEMFNLSQLLMTCGIVGTGLVK